MQGKSNRCISARVCVREFVDSSSFLSYYFEIQPSHPDLILLFAQAEFHVHLLHPFVAKARFAGVADTHAFQLVASTSDIHGAQCRQTWL